MNAKQRRMVEKVQRLLMDAKTLVPDVVAFLQQYAPESNDIINRVREFHRLVKEVTGDERG